MHWLFFLLLIIFAFFAARVGAATSYSFSSSLKGWTNSRCELKDGALTIAKKDGKFYSSCSITRAVKASSVSGKHFKMSATRYDSLIAGDMEGLSSSDVAMYQSNTATDNTALAAGRWYTDATSATKKPSFAADADGDTAATVDDGGSLTQVFKITPGGDYRLKFSAGLSGLGIQSDNDDQLFYLSLRFYDANLAPLEFYNPVNGTTDSLLGNFRNYAASRGDVDEEFLLRMIDCDDHVMYEGGSVTSPDDVVFNFCEDADGTALKTDPDDDAATSDGAAYDESDIVYAGISFAVNSGDGTGVALDDVSLEYEAQIETQFLKMSGGKAALAKTLQSSTQDAGFYVEPNDAITHLKIILRTDRDDAAPQIAMAEFTDGEPLTVSYGAKSAEFDAPRLGFTGSIPPAQEWYDEGDVRSVCLDPFKSDAQTDCWEFLVKYGIGRWRVAMSPAFLKTGFDGTDYSFSFFDGTIDASDGVDAKKDPVNELKHYAEAASYGMKFLMIVDNQCEGTFWWRDAYPSTNTVEYDCWWDADGNLNADYDPAPGDAANDVEQSITLMGEAAAFLARKFSGGGSYAFSDNTTVLLPQMDNFQIFVETNIAEPDWVDALSDAGHAEVLTSVAQAVKTEKSDAIVETSLNPNNTSITRAFDKDYLASAKWTGVDASAYDRFNFNTFNGSTENDLQPEDFIAAWSDLKQESYMSGWSGKTLVVGADSYSRAVYDPACASEMNTSGTWERGSGDARQAKLVARWALSALSLPTEAIYYYVPFPADGWGGGNLYHEACWRSLEAPYLFERVSGTGILGNSGSDAATVLGDSACPDPCDDDDPVPDGADEPTQFKPNDAGLAWLTIGRYVSETSPVKTSLEAEDDDHGERHYAVLLETAEGERYLALWFYRPSHHGAAFMDYVSGFSDDGFTGKRLYDVTLKKSALLDAADLSVALELKANPLSSSQTQSDAVLDVPATSGGAAKTSSIADVATKSVLSAGAVSDSPSGPAGTYLISLDGSDTQKLETSSGGNGQITIQNVPVGEMPVLIRLED